MTPEEDAAMQVIVAQVAEEAMNDGIMAAVQMMRLGVQKHPHLTTLQLADAIEATVTKDPSRQQ